MMPRSQSNPSGAENFGLGIKPKKKPAPPRPPQPKFQNSQSFRSASELKSYQRSLTISNEIGRPTQKSFLNHDHDNNHDNNLLIDFSTPPPSPPKSALSNLNTRIVAKNEFLYRVGASIFYRESPLKNSSQNPTATPFSPPRPSAESMLSTPVKTSKPNYTNYHPNTTTNTNHSSTNPAPTIIRQQHGGSGSSTSTSNSSSGGIITSNNNNNNNWNANSQQQQQAAQTNQNRYSNVGWESPPKKVHPVIAPKPTIIRPAPTTTIQQTKRNYYDEPPVESEPEIDDRNEWDDDTIDSPPMPAEPPPPPPPDVEEAVPSEWLEGTANAETYYNTDQIPESYGGVEGDHPYAIALYDYAPEAEGDLPLQVGDLVYLTKVIDESWLYGMCGALEGMFPATYVNVVVPLPDQSEQLEVIQAEVLNTAVPSSMQSNSAEIVENQEGSFAKVGKYYYADVLYQFIAETENDLSLEPGDVVTIWGRINDDWLYGALKRERGQFPATFVQPVPDDLPIINL